MHDLAGINCPSADQISKGCHVALPPGHLVLSVSVVPGSSASVPGFLHLFLLVADGRDIEVRLVAKMGIVRALRALQPLCKLLLRASLTEIAEDRSPLISLLITMFVLKDRSHLLASGADSIPQVPISDIASEAPDDVPSWYSPHQELLLIRRVVERVLSLEAGRRSLLRRNRDS
jgi:hypothetical protein